MKATIVSGPERLATTIAEWQAARTQAIRFAEQSMALEAAIVNALPALTDGTADAVRIGDQVVSRRRGVLMVEPWTPFLDEVMGRRDTTKTMSHRELIDRVNQEQRVA